MTFMKQYNSKLSLQDHSSDQHKEYSSKYTCVFIKYGSPRVNLPICFLRLAAFLLRGVSWAKT